MASTESPIVTDVKLQQPLKIPSPMAVATYFFSIVRY